MGSVISLSIFRMSEKRYSQNRERDGHEVNYNSNKWYDRAKEKQNTQNIIQSELEEMLLSTSTRDLDTEPTIKYLESIENLKLVAEYQLVPRGHPLYKQAIAKLYQNSPITTPNEANKGLSEKSDYEETHLRTPPEEMK